MTDQTAAASYFGESWHDMHHFDPACARHGAGPRQFERLGWATAVRWPVPARRRCPSQDPPRQALQLVRP